MVEYYFLSMITDFRLKVFETVARRLNFTRAAEELFITQPAVTRHIKELERLLDAYTINGIREIDDLAALKTYCGNLGGMKKIFQAFGNQENFMSAVREMENILYDAA